MDAGLMGGISGGAIGLANLLMLPKPYNWFLWLPYGIALPPGIRWCNQRQARIRAEDAAARTPGIALS